jgi:acetolactate synthase-1/2/3 large subunit
MYAFSRNMYAFSRNMYAFSRNIPKNSMVCNKLYINRRDYSRPYLNPYDHNLNTSVVSNTVPEYILAKDIIHNALLRNNVKHTFIFSGGSIMPVIDKLYDSSINYTVNSHEQNCGHSATGYAKSSNNTGVVIVTSGPGITNMITPMLDATNDSTPMVVISGQVSKNAVGTNAFQEAPAVELSKHVTKWCHQISSVEEIDFIIDKAFKVANDRKKGAVHIDIPKCISSGKIEKNNYELILENRDKETEVSKKIKKMNDFLKMAGTGDVAEMISMCERPIIYLGQGCVDSYELLREYAIESNIPVTSTIHANGIFDEDHELSLQWCGMHGNAAANYALQEADCIIALGSRFDDRTTGNLEEYAPKAFESFNTTKIGGIVHVNIEKSEIKKVINSHYNFNIDCGVFLNEALRWTKYNPREEWISRINELKSNNKFKFNRDIETNEKNENLFMEDVLTELYKKTKNLEDKVIFTTGVGNHQMQTYQFIKSHYPKKIISSGSLGVMGVGLPYSIGAQIANPDKTVICIDGDSSFNMTLTDLKTVVENKLPIKIAIMNNDAQMMVTIWEKLFYEERYTATLNKRNPSFTAIAESYGLKSMFCDNINSLQDTVDEFINYNDGPILCEFKIEKTMCLPLVAPGKALDEMMLDDDGKMNLNGGIAPS